MKPSRAAAALVCVVVVLVGGSATAGASSDPGPSDLRVVTVPAVAGAVFTLDGVPYTTDASGELTVPGVGSLAGLDQRLQYQGGGSNLVAKVDFTRLYDVGAASSSREVVAQFLRSDAVNLSFVDQTGGEVPLERVERVVLKSSLGVEFAYDGAQLAAPQVLPSVRTIPSPTGRETKDIYYTVQEVTIDGTNVVNRSQQKFLPAQVDQVSIETQFFRVEVRVADAFFGVATGDAVLVRWPDGAETSYPVVDGKATLPLLPRGDYKMRVDGPGLVTWRPVSVSSDQAITLDLMTVYDIGAVVLAVVVLAVGLVLIGRRRARSHRTARAARSTSDAGATGDRTATPSEAGVG
jgi:hypothetical protein